MAATSPGASGTAEIAERLAAVEARVARLEETAPRPAARAAALRLPAPPAPAAPPIPAPGWPAPPPAPAAAPDAPEAGRRPRLDLEDLLGGRVLALVGGGAVVLAAVFFLGLAAERGWIGPAVRLAVAATVSGALVAVGALLHERRGRTQAARVTAAAGIGGLFLSLVAATSGYGLLPAAVTLPLAGAVGALATWLAVRWDARPVAWLGIGGGLLAPPALLAAPSAETLGFLVVAFAAAAGVAVLRRWHGLLVGAALAVLPQVGWWAGEDPAAGALVVVLVLVGAVPLAAAVIGARRSTAAADLTVPALLAGATAWWLGVLGVAGLPAGAHPWWLALVAAGTAAAAAAAVTGAPAEVRRAVPTRGATTTAATAMLLGVGVLWTATGGLADHGSRLAVLTAATAAVAGLERLARRTAAGHGGDTEAVDLLALVALAATTVSVLDGWLALGVLLAEVGALRLLAIRTAARTAAAGAAALWLVALLEVVAEAAPLTALVEGLHRTPEAVVGLGAVTAAAGAAAGLHPAHRRAWAAAAAGAAGYLASTLLVSGALAVGDPQWAQVLLGATWTLAGAGLLALGLRREARDLRVAGFALLGLAVGKAVVYDLSALDLGQRAASFLALGLLLLVAGFGYQRRRRSAI